MSLTGHCDCAKSVALAWGVHVMSSVFISYAKEDAATARMLVDALQRAGFSVWWDRHIPPGKTWDDVIGRALETAACVIVLWSETSVQSRWVREEAERAASRGCLIPVLVEKVDPPFGFGRIQAADLSGWRGDEHAPEFAGLFAAVSDLAKTPARNLAPDEPIGAPVKPVPVHTKIRSKFLWIASGMIAVAVASYLVSPSLRAPHPEAPSQEKTAVLATRPSGARPEPVPSPPIGPSRPIKPPRRIGQLHPGCGSFDDEDHSCVEFKDEESVINRGPITRIIVYHAGYVHGIQIWYGYGTDGIGKIQGFADSRYVGKPDTWLVPDGERITRVVGVLSPATTSCPSAPAKYVSQLQFFTDGGNSSRRFGTRGGEQFLVEGSSTEALRTISGSWNRREHKCFNRAVFTMTFEFGTW